MPRDDPDRHPWIHARRRGYERAALALMASGAVLVLAAVLVANLAFEEARRWGSGVAAVGLLLTAASMAATLPLRTLRTVPWANEDRNAHGRAARWMQLKTASILLNLLALLGGMALLIALLNRMGVFDVVIPSTLFLRVAGALLAALALAHAAAHLLSLRVPLERASFALEPAFFLLGMAGSAVFGLLALGVTVGTMTLPGGARLRAEDGAYFVLAGLVFASFTLFVSRSLPTVYALFADQRDFLHGRAFVSRAKSVVMPAMVAFALLFLIVFLVLVFGVGVAGFVEQTKRSTLMLGTLLLIAAAMIGSVATAFFLARSEDRIELYRRKMTVDEKRGLVVLGVSLGVAALLLLLAALLKAGVRVPGFPAAWWLDILTFGVLAALGPYGFFVAARHRRIKRMEERFPDFLRDLASSSKAGLTLPQAATIAAKGEYGALSPEIGRMADQLSWNVPFDEALQRFGNRVDTPLVQRAVGLITEASRSGGHVTDVLMAAAKDVREIKNLENERRLTMGLYTVIIYLTFFVFLGVAAVIYGRFVPEILASAEAGRELGSGGFGGVSFQQVSLDDYRTFYYLAAVMQGLGNGMVAGLMGTGRVLSGLRHSFAMVLFAFLAFALML